IRRRADPRWAMRAVSTAFARFVVSSESCVCRMRRSSSGIRQGATMTSAAADLVTSTGSRTASIQAHLDRAIDDLLRTLPNPERLSAAERRGMIARYTAVLEGNFIYWMTGAYLSAGSDEARAKIIDNLREEVRDCHPGLMRRFAIAARAVPRDQDAQDVYRNLMHVRLFSGRLSPVPT